MLAPGVARFSFFFPQRRLMLRFGASLLQGDLLDLEDMESLDPENYALCASLLRSCVESGLGENDRASWSLRLKFLETDLGVLLERNYGWRGK